MSTEMMSLQTLLDTVKDGDEIGWMNEFSRLCQDAKGRQEIQDLVTSISVNGIQEPVLIGSDGRLWDGHHRVCAAYILGLKEIPVEFAEDRSLSKKYSTPTTYEVFDIYKNSTNNGIFKDE